MGPGRSVRTWIASVAAMVSLGGCTSVTVGAPVAESFDGGPDSCAVVDPPMETIESKNAGEPQLRIPRPPGWERNAELDSDLIRYAIVNSGLADGVFAPNAVVTLERIPGTDVTAREVTDQQLKSLTTLGGVSDVRTTPGMTCGLVSDTVTYTLPSRGGIPAHPATVVIVTGPFNGDTYSATVTVQTTDPTNATYQSDSDAILTGFQMLSGG